MTMTMRPRERLLFEGADWDFSTLQRIHDACEDIALNELGLDVYPNQIEVITSEQMLDAYSSTGMPLFYAIGPSANTSRITKPSTAAGCATSPMRSSSTALPAFLT